MEIIVRKRSETVIYERVGRESSWVKAFFEAAKMTTMILDKDLFWNTDQMHRVNLSYLA